MKVFIIFLLGFVMFFEAANAQVQVNSIEEALQLAVQHNLLLQKEKQNIEVQQAQKKITNAQLLPQVRGFSTLDYNYALPVQLIPAELLGGQPGEYKEIQFGVDYALSAGVEVAVPLVNTSYWLNSKMAGKRAELADKVYKTAEIEMKEQVVRMYYLVLLSQEALMIAQQNALINDSLYYSAEAKHRNGLVEQLDLNRIRNVQLHSRAVFAQNKAVLQQNLNNLKLLLGVEQNKELRVIGNLNEASVGTVIEKSLQRTNSFPALQARQLQYNIAELQLKRDKLQSLPQLSFYTRFTTQAQRNSFNFLDANEPWYQFGVAGLRLEWPLFTGFARTNLVKQAHVQLQMANLDLLQEQQQTKAEDANLLLALEQSAATLQAAKEQYQLNQQNRNIALLKYSEGIYSIDQYLNIYNEMLSAQNNYLRSASELYINQSQIHIYNQF